MKRFMKKDGFTLIELLVVILIIAILMAVAAPSFLGQTKKANNSNAQQQLQIAYKAAKAWTIQTNNPTESYQGFSKTALLQYEPELGGVTVTPPTTLSGALVMSVSSPVVCTLTVSPSSMQVVSGPCTS